MTNQILKSTMLFSGFVFLAQIIGLIRDLYLVRYFGVGSVLDTYYLAFKIPDLLNVFYSVFLGSVILIPLLTKAKHNQGDEGVWRQISKIGSMVGFLVVIFSGFLFFAMPYLVGWLVPNWDENQLKLLTNLSQTLLFAQLFFPIGILAGCIGMVYGRPFTMALAGAVYNLFILLGAIFLSPLYGIYGVVYGVILGAIFFALVQIIPHPVRIVLSAFKFQIQFKEWFAFIKENLGRFFTVLLNQSFLIIILALAAKAGTGGVTIFNNAFNVYMAIFFILGASFSTVIMPHNSQLFVSGKIEELKTNLHTSLTYIFVISILFTLLAFLFSKNIIETLYYFSNLRELELVQMSLIFGLLILSLPFFNMIEVARKYMYATHLVHYTVLIMLVFLFSLLVGNQLLLNFGLNNLVSLSFAFIFGNVLALATILLLLNLLGRLDFIFILKNIYKSFLVFILSVLTYTLIFPLLEELLMAISNFYFLNLCLSGLTILLIYLFFVFMFKDAISKDVIFRILELLKRSK